MATKEPKYKSEEEMEKEFKDLFAWHSKTWRAMLNDYENYPFRSEKADRAFDELNTDFYNKWQLLRKKYGMSDLMVKGKPWKIK